MKHIGFLGCGKIGKSLLQEVKDTGLAEVSFIQDPFYQGSENFPVTEEADESLLAETDLVVESAMADVLKKNFDRIIRHADLMPFSVTAFSDEEFYEHALEMMKKYHRRIFLPHGAILGVDGIADGRKVITGISIETTKNPKSLGRSDTERTVVYDGTARGACAAYPRNVNVHATVALAGIGFDRTHSRIVSDPAVHTNSHVITVEGEGIHFVLDISSFANGGVTGKYTPYSAIGSLHRVLSDGEGLRFV